MSYFVTITSRKKQVLDEQGPFESIDDALSFVCENGYFLAPKTPPALNGYVGLDRSGLARLFITRATAGTERIADEIFSIMIRRDDYHLAKIENQKEKHTTH